MLETLNSRTVLFLKCIPRTRFTRMPWRVLAAVVLVMDFFRFQTTWYRLLQDFLIHKEDESRLLPSAFEKYSANVFGAVASGKCEPTADLLWNRLEARLCSRAQLYALQDELFGLQRNDPQMSVVAFGERLRSASLVLQTPEADEILLNKFKAGLFTRL